jgi:L-cysteine/cystine lyase
MSLSPERRHFIKSAVASGVYTALQPALGAASQLARAAPADDWVAAARAEIPGLSGGGYFQTGAFGLSPQRVMDRTKELLEFQNLSPAHPHQTGALREIDATCRQRLAETVGAKPAEVALMANTTTGLNTVLWSIDWRPGDEIIIGSEEHPALLLPVYNLERRFGVVRRVVPVDRHDEVVTLVQQTLSTRTRLVAMSHVSRGSGHLLPARALASALRERQVPLLLDGAQGAGNVPVNFRELGCDYYSLCGHKWLLGPKGTGALLVREDRIETTPPSWTGSNAQSSMDEDGAFTWQPDARRYEFATRFQAGFGGWVEALQWLGSLGWDRIHQRIRELAAHASATVAHSRRLQLVSPSEREQQNGIVVVRLPAGPTALDAYTRLREEDRMLVSPVSHPQDLRVCLHFYNTEAEFDQLLSRLEYYSS